MMSVSRGHASLAELDDGFTCRENACNMNIIAETYAIAMLMSCKICCWCHEQGEEQGDLPLMVRVAGCLGMQRPGSIGTGWESIVSLER